MKELVIISGKGGTGKTSITASFAALAKHAVLADCDVDAADLHLILRPEIQRTNPFYSGHEAIIRQADCTGCSLCQNLCRFDAIKETRGTFQVDPASCEGCGVCVHFCPAKAIDFPERFCGEWFISKTRCGTMVHARLGIGAENSGKLVSTVRGQTKQFAQAVQADWILVDGPPGTGCPVIASITGADAVLAVTEPTLSGQHDLLRVLELTRHFEIPAFVCVNKWDINPEMTELIETAASSSGATVLTRIPYDKSITEAQMNGLSVVEYNEGTASQFVQTLWEKLCQQMKK
ncbi:MAG: ATP-binding protein [Pontiellaceae bacterium]|jgi:MinD superfamily P-loop ATPase|nr:ATP-binding protein [Pontiellaceae bacterium]